MKNILLVIIFIAFLIFFNRRIAYAQDSASSCKVLSLNINTYYKGECKNGLADGQGEARGRHRYNGSFKFGKPDGYGIYYYDDNTYYAGYFLEGQREGKGETHYLDNGKPDSIIKGYWSGNEFRGKKYVTYSFNGATRLDRYEIKATPESGRTITFELATTSGSPTGIPTDFSNSPGYVLRLVQLEAAHAAVRLQSSIDRASRSYVIYDIDAFPVTLFGTLSNGDNFTLELYKPAKWNVRFYINR